MKEMLEQGDGMILIGCMVGIGIVVRMILLAYYRSLIKACKRFAETKNKTIGSIREDLKRYEKRDLRIKSTMLYVECHLAERKILGIRVGSLESVWQQSLLLVPLSGVLSAFSSVLSKGVIKEALFVLFVSSGMTFVLLLADLLIGLREKQKRVRLYLRDYIDNHWMSQMPEDVGCEERKGVINIKRAREKKAERGMEENGKGKSKHKRQVQYKTVSKKKKGKAQEEKRRLTEELLRERRQLEARSFAEQRRMEREAEIQMQADRVQEEAAATATEVSYETLLSEVLTEYLV